MTNSVTSSNNAYDFQCAGHYLVFVCSCNYYATTVSRHAGVGSFDLDDKCHSVNAGRLQGTETTHSTTILFRPIPHYVIYYNTTHSVLHHLLQHGSFCTLFCAAARWRAAAPCTSNSESEDLTADAATQRNNLEFGICRRHRLWTTILPRRCKSLIMCARILQELWMANLLNENLKYSSWNQLTKIYTYMYVDPTHIVVGVPEIMQHNCVRFVGGWVVFPFINLSAGLRGDHRERPGQTITQLVQRHNYPMCNILRRWGKELQPTFMCIGWGKTTLKMESPTYSFDTLYFYIHCNNKHSYCATFWRSENTMLR